MDRAFLHACTPVRCAFTLLGNAPSGTLPNTLLRSCLYACALVLAFSLHERGPILALSSWIMDLTSPDARRQTARRWLALLAASSLPVLTIEMGCSGTRPKQRQKKLRLLLGEFQWLPVGVSLTGHGTHSTRKRGMPMTMLLSIPTPSLSAPARHLPCQGQPLKRATTNEWSGLPVCGCCKAARAMLRGAKVVTRTAQTASSYILNGFLSLEGNEVKHG